ncbi:hypothetical protein AYR66_21170 [Noviherbaspirillum denitrificans]|uniref:Single Cache domain-containing protein n=1 Tax=Noviherbaspirillum denitrificans TaxID=1968433 RepID=A0A254TQQ1_9BURK|nr:hypothetical protein AYR66_21170 [Noviherbaspirillum denitrificans]
MSRLSSVFIGVAVLCSAQSALAETERESEVKQLVKKAAAHIKTNGLDKACKDFSSTDTGFLKGELYVFVQDVNIKVLCHPTNARLVGKELLDLKDADGKAFNHEMAELAKSKGSGWITYRWPNPVTQQIGTKTTYIERVGDMIVGSGIYK